MNRIPEVQNEEIQLERLAAQRYLYSRSKLLLSIQLVLGGPVAVAWALGMIWYPEIKGAATLWGVTVSISDVVWLTWLNNCWREAATKIQEQFDCHIFELPWNNIKVGDPPTPEEVHENAEEYARRGSLGPSLENWYPISVQNLPIYAARIICQRINCWWDGKQRRRYAQSIVSVTVLVFVIILWVFFSAEITLPNFLLKVMGPALPAALIGLRQWNEQREAATRLENLRRHAERLWQQALGGSDESTLNALSRQLQDEIFQSRKSNPLVFDSLYALWQPSNEVQMKRAVADMIDEWNRRSLP